jgi:FKBP-type peptidyl-prolyl cis-trans isomerase
MVAHSARAYALAASLVIACNPVEPARSSVAPTASAPPAEVSIDDPEPEIVEEPDALQEPDAALNSEPKRRTDPDGLVIEELAIGTGRAARAGDRVVVHYDGRLVDGTEFDSSRKRGQPFEIELGRKMLIEGFERALDGMRPGGVRRATIPPELGYGARSTGGKIPPNATLVFEIELVAIR